VLLSPLPLQNVDGTALVKWHQIAQWMDDSYDMTRTWICYYAECGGGGGAKNLSN
jgi:hypothetical protein